MARLAKKTEHAKPGVARNRGIPLPRRQPGRGPVFGDLAAFLREVAGDLAREFGADAASIWLREPNGALRCACHDSGRLASREAPAGLKKEYEVAECISSQALPRTLRPVVLRGCARNSMLRQFWKPFTSGRVETTLAIPIPESAHEKAELSGWCLLLHQRGKTFPSADIDRAAIRGQQLSLAIRVARAAAKAKELAVVAERNRIARELHDTLVQSFTAILLQIEDGKALLHGEEKAALAVLERARDWARGTLLEARRAVRAMRPRALDGSDLPVAIEGLVSEMAAGSGVTAEVTLRGTMPALTMEMETNLLRIIQEAVTNVLRHARARAIHVHLVFAGDFLKAWVEDDGCGFSLRDARNGDGFGLISMRERAETLSGKLLISSHPARGTRVLVKIPLSKG